ncbi:unnamed protein product [Lactuca saligna]|uniref:Uncharacterized protein n=1 Tax=Lactuca saligna TaxID=75948 RepID=A0AA35ZCL4_LACSI|nr:unnamed protein product [Lactuca saligna]
MALARNHKSTKNEDRSRGNPRGCSLALLQLQKGSIAISAAEGQVSSSALSYPPLVFTTLSVDHVSHVSDTITPHTLFQNPTITSLSSTVDNKPTKIQSGKSNSTKSIYVFKNSSSTITNSRKNTMEIEPVLSDSSVCFISSFFHDLCQYASRFLWFSEWALKEEHDGKTTIIGSWWQGAIAGGGQRW